MINKFRYKKPLQGETIIDSAGSEKKCDNDTLTRKDKSIVFSSTLDTQLKMKLRQLFSELQHSSAKALPPDSLRKALADSFLDQQRFQVGFMDDAAECFENMLLRIHDHVAHKEPEDACSAPHCISHQKFAMTLLEQSICNNCGATTEPLNFTQMVQYVSTSTLVHQLRVSIGQTGRPDTFGRLLQKASNMGDTRQCPASCGSVTQMCRVLMNHPEIVSIGLAWSSEKPTLEHIMEVFSCIDTTLKLNHVFNNVTDTRWAETSTHNLVGVVTYYGKHYSTFFFHTKLMEWIFLDDATVRTVGPRWEQVVEKCHRGKFQPLLLLYANPNGTPVNLDYAPKLNTSLKTTQQQLLRRSVTPSPEKPTINSTRRAITPNPESSQLNQKPPLPRPYNEYQNLSVIQKNISNIQQGCDQVDGEYISKKPQVNIHRTLSNGSSSGVESGVCIPDHMNVPRRRDSGNWSGDRNSASSASSTTMENPYLYLVGKLPPGSPTRTDAGYDSYSISSNESTNMTTLQHMMKSGHLAQIPEDYSNISNKTINQNCDVLCDEADELLVKSRQLEDAHDLVLALALCNAAATKARAAMNAPYNNPQTLTLARMKHNTCIMRARSLHRRMTQTQNLNKENSPEIRHTREGSSGSGRHSRQNSREKGQHSRQNSRELLLQQEKEMLKPTKSIEIYATLPKRKDALKAIKIEDEEYMLYSTKPLEKDARESRSIFSRAKNNIKFKEKRSRSEDRNKISRSDFSIAPEISAAKDTLKKAKENKEKEKEKDNKDGKKKQHKIRRKLLMGGLIRRKNRSMPDLTDSNAEEAQPPVNDSRESPTEIINPGMSGYLSEGHLEFSAVTSANPNLERSKLMRKSFHGSAGKILTAAKVPPPPPLRTTSQLSRSKSNVSEVSNIYGDSNIYHNLAPFNQSLEEQSSMSLPYYGNSNNSSYDDELVNQSSNTVVTQAEVHHDHSGFDEVDCLPAHARSTVLADLPPYPSPGGSAIHSRQASEDFPPPPPPLDLSALDECLSKIPEPNSLLAQLQNKRQEILTHQDSKLPPLLPAKSSGDTWLKELQAKQAALRMKNKDKIDDSDGLDEVNTQRYLPGEAKLKSVKDLASKFEVSNTNLKPQEVKARIAAEQIAEEIREVEMLTSAVNKVFEKPCDDKLRPQKKKSVSFCDQVTLVATAEEQEDDTYIPNPILERVLRSAANNPETVAVKQELVSLRNQTTLDSRVSPMPQNDLVKRNSIENLIQDSSQMMYYPSPQMQPQYPNQQQYVRPDEQYYTYQPQYMPQNYGFQEQQVHSKTMEPNNNQSIYGEAPYRNYQNGYGLNEQPTNNHQPIYDLRQSPYQPIPQNSSAYQPQNAPIPQNSTQYHPVPQNSSPYQPVPQNSSPYQPVPQNSTPYQPVPQNSSPYQPVPQNQSPYQPIPQNSQMHPAYYSARRNIQPQNNYNNYIQPNIRQTTPSPNLHPPSPVPSVSSCNKYYPAMYRNSPSTVYQRLPQPQPQNFPQEVYQRVPAPHGEYSAYQQVPQSKHLLKKSVSFEPGTKGCESPIPQPVVTPIVVNNAHNSIPTDKTKCSLCRKKNVVALNLYCKDCEFYMSRFKPKT
ncbi:unnamed protein product [Ceutorhynchus assimilis]|uniref:USP domain-containing protein n=1 Tax=Ceutorhynchus assimilis TaxID=467358 RepID=A0A9N9MJN2_9CUCU|nr:unnamed protein product [Ceutorhynchus assimilis]